MEHQNNKSLTFYQPDLNIEYEEHSGELYPSDNFYYMSNNFYRLVYVYKGELQVYDKNTSIYLKKGEMAICPPDKDFGLHRTIEETDFVKMWFLPTATLPERSTDFYRSFILPDRLEKLRPKRFDNKICYEVLQSFPASLEQKRERSHFSIKLKAIVDELGVECDKKYKRETFDKHNISIKLIEYVKNNYGKNITMKTLCDEFSVSESTINRVFRLMRGTTFSQYLNRVRLTAIKKMLDDETLNNSLSIAKIAEMHGYKTYSTFYRQYVSFYGEKPKLANKKNERPSWPLD